jgi:hypothetical protein
MQMHGLADVCTMKKTLHASKVNPSHIIGDDLSVDSRVSHFSLARACVSIMGNFY